MGLPPLRIGLLGVVAVMPAIVTGYAVSRSAGPECTVAPDVVPSVAGAAAGSGSTSEGVAASASASPSRAAGPAGAAPRAAAAAKTPRAMIDAHIAEIARRYRLSAPVLAAVIAVESEFNPRAVSRRGARGLMQLMPTTAARLGVRDPFDPRQNIDGGARYLRELMNRFSNDLPLALAAYNAGHRAVVAHGGVPPYPETRAFVTRVLGRLGMVDDAVAIARSDRRSAGGPATRVAGMRLAPRAVTLRRPLTPEPATSSVAPAVVSVALDDLPPEPLVVTIDLPRESLDLPSAPGDPPLEPAARRRSTPATPVRIADAQDVVAPPPSSGTLQAP
jgi:hypothetical protein